MSRWGIKHKRDVCEYSQSLDDQHKTNFFFFNFKKSGTMCVYVCVETLCLWGDPQYLCGETLRGRQREALSTRKRNLHTSVIEPTQFPPRSPVYYVCVRRRGGGTVGDMIQRGGCRHGHGYTELQ